MILEIIILIVLILVNAFFAASEIALISLKDNKVKKMAENGDKKAKMLYHLLTSPGRFLATIQLGITLAGFLASAFAAGSFAGPLAQTLYNVGVPIALPLLETIALVVITILLSYFTLVIGELVPKQLALQKAEAVANFTVVPLTFLFKVSYPFVKLLNLSTNLIVRIFGVDPNAENEEATEEEIRMMVDVGGERGTIQTTEKLMINNIFEFNDKTVSDIMTHRTDMSALSVESSLKEVIQLVNIKQYTRFPVYQDSIDNIIGVLHTKDLIRFLENDDRSQFKMEEMIRKPYFVLETQRVDVVFKDMQQQHVHIAIVIDEYGGTDGMITLEDVIEEIVGEIFSEHDKPELAELEIKELRRNQYQVAGIAHLYQLEERLGIDLPTEDYDTLNGFLIGQLGRIPLKGEQPTIEYKGISFEVKKTAEKRIEQVIVTMKKQGEVSEADED